MSIPVRAFAHRRSGAGRSSGATRHFGKGLTVDKPISIALVGLGKIARDQHLPAIAGNDTFAFAGAASLPPADHPAIRCATIEELLAADPGIQAVAICTPPQGRHRIAAAALRAGKHVLIEKPPAATLGEASDLIRIAREQGVVLFTAWHSRFAGGVAVARDWLAERRITGVRITWKENVRVWHPGQEWIFAAGGLGVFDPLINALSILTEIAPGEWMASAATLDFPANRDAPIATRLTLGKDGAATEIEADFLFPGTPCWEIVVETDRGTVRLEQGGGVSEIDGVRTQHDDREYAGIYRRFAETIAANRSDADIAPLRIVADAFLIGKRQAAPAFEF